MCNTQHCTLKIDKPVTQHTHAPSRSVRRQFEQGTCQEPTLHSAGQAWLRRAHLLRGGPPLRGECRKCPPQSKPPSDAHARRCLQPCLCEPLPVQPPQPACASQCCSSVLFCRSPCKKPASACGVCCPAHTHPCTRQNHAGCQEGAHHRLTTTVGTPPTWGNFGRTAVTDCALMREAARRLPPVLKMA